MHRIVYFECGKYKYRVGENKVKQIHTEEKTPGLWVITFDDGSFSTVAPTETFLLHFEKQNIIVPDVVVEKAS